MLGLKPLIKKMLLKHISVDARLDSLLYVTYYVANLGMNYGSSVKITPPSVSGYKFVCWLHSASIGWICDTYINTSEGTLWNGNKGMTGYSGTGQVRVYALYIKN